jgi:hypothetical protein
MVLAVEALEVHGDGVASDERLVTNPTHLLFPQVLTPAIVAYSSTL